MTSGMTNRMTSRPRPGEPAHVRTAPHNQARRDAPVWYFDLTAWAVALSVIGYPIAGLIASYLGIGDDTISIIYRVFIASLSGFVFVKNTMKFGLGTIDNMLILFMFIYIIRLTWDYNVGETIGIDRIFLFYVVAVITPVLLISLPRGGWYPVNANYCFFVVGSAVTTLALLMFALGVG
jgi:hypothetical protein